MGWRIAGHQGAVEVLDRAVREQRCPHAHLFTGPLSVGKMTLALELAKALNCSEGSAPCAACRSCRRIERGVHADIGVLGVQHGDGEPGQRRVEIGIDQVRELSRRSAVRPYEGRRRVFVVDGADRLSEEAGNALLKTLEEPPEATVLVLLAPDSESLPATLVSRCSVLALRPMPEDTVAVEVSRRAGVEAPEAQRLARLSHGCLGWALRAAHDPGVLQEEEQRLDQVAELLEERLEARFAYAERLAGQFGRDRDRAREELHAWHRYLRYLLLACSGRPDLVPGRERLPTLHRHAGQLGAAGVVGALRTLQDVGGRLERNANPRLALEVMMLELPQVPAGEAVPGQAA